MSPPHTHTHIPSSFHTLWNRQQHHSDAVKMTISGCLKQSCAAETAHPTANQIFQRFFPTASIGSGRGGEYYPTKMSQMLHLTAISRKLKCKTVTELDLHRAKILYGAYNSKATTATILKGLHKQNKRRGRPALWKKAEQNRTGRKKKRFIHWMQMQTATTTTTKK